MSSGTSVGNSSILLPTSLDRDCDQDGPVPLSSALSYSLEDLGLILGGTGRAQACWDCFRIGVDPIWLWNPNRLESEEDGDDEREVGIGIDDCGSVDEKDDALTGWTRRQLYDSKLISQLRQENGLGPRTVDLLKERFGSIESTVASISKISTSPDGTTKLLLNLHQDGLEIETVIIPWSDRKTSTLCVSSQVGCKQGCTFCSTGRMGKLRSLSSDEILAQLYWANKICRLRSGTLYTIQNIVFMGMGEPADNSGAVKEAAQRMMDPKQFQLANRRVTISTVAPTPESFHQLVGDTNAVLAWSVHATRDDLRKKLVPTTKHSMEELRDALSLVLLGRSRRQRNIMFEITLLDQINDSVEDALHLVAFCQPLLNKAKAKLIVNLIPWNDIGASFGPASSFRSPDPARVAAFQKVVNDSGILCYVRTTRGDEDDAACGMLATSSKKKSGSRSC